MPPLGDQADDMTIRSLVLVVTGMVLILVVEMAMVQKRLRLIDRDISVLNGRIQTIEALR